MVIITVVPHPAFVEFDPNNCVDDLRVSNLLFSSQTKRMRPRPPKSLLIACVLLAGCKAKQASTAQIAHAAPKDASASTDTVSVREVTDAESSSDLQRIALLLHDGDADAVLLFNTASGQQLSTIPLRTVPRTIALSPDGSTLAVGYGAPAYGIELYNASTGKSLNAHLQDQPDRDLTLGHAEVFALAYSPDSQTLLALVDDGYAAWHLPDGHLLWQYADPGSEDAAAPTGALGLNVAPSASAIALTRTGKTYVIAWNGKAVRYRYTVSTGGPAQFSIAGDLVGATAVGSADSQLWSTQTGRPVARIPGCGGMVGFVPSGLVCLTANQVQLHSLAAPSFGILRRLPLPAHAQLLQAGKHVLLYGAVVDGAWRSPNQAQSVTFTDVETGQAFTLHVPGR